jgi:hypothetical protein
LAYAFCGGESLSNNKTFFRSVTGISISPKQNEFCVIKIWTSTLDFQDASIVNKVAKTITPIGCLFSPFKKTK